MTNKQEQAIKTLYKDGIIYKEINKTSIETGKEKYIINGKLYCSNSIAMFNERGSFLCAGSYAVFTKDREAYDKFFEIREADTKHYKTNFNANEIYKPLMQKWNDYLSNKYIKTTHEGVLPKDWKQYVETKEYKGYLGQTYMIGETMLNKVYINHVIKFIKSNIHWIIIGNRLQPVFLTDGNVIAVIMPIRYNN